MHAGLSLKKEWGEGGKNLSDPGLQAETASPKAAQRYLSHGGLCAEKVPGLSATGLLKSRLQRSPWAARLTASALTRERLQAGFEFARCVH